MLRREERERIKNRIARLERDAQPLMEEIQNLREVLRKDDELRHEWVKPTSLEEIIGPGEDNPLACWRCMTTHRKTEKCVNSEEKILPGFVKVDL